MTHYFRYALAATIALTFGFIVIAIGLFHDTYCRKLSRVWAILILAILNIKIHIQGDVENFNCRKNGIIIANHRSYFDIPILLAATNIPICWVATKQMSEICVLGSHLKNRHIVVDNSTNNSYKKIGATRNFIYKSKDAISKGLWVAIFPEGGINRRYAEINLEPFFKGAFWSACLSKCDIWSATIIGAEGLWPSWKNIPKSGNIRVIIKKVVDGNSIHKKDLQSICFSCMAAIEWDLRAHL